MPFLEERQKRLECGYDELPIIEYLDKKGVVSLILVKNRRLWTCKGLNCHVKKVF